MPESIYEHDVLAWPEHQAELLRRLGRGETVDGVDWTNVAEESKAWGGQNSTTLRNASPG
jgi:hypothetical protein